MQSASTLLRKPDSITSLQVAELNNRKMDVNYCSPSGLLGRYLRLLRTLRYLRLRQITYQLLYRIAPVRVQTRVAEHRIIRIASTNRFIKREISVERSEDALLSFTFLNSTRTYRGTPKWRDNTASMLWLYNLHYFDWLNGTNAESTESPCLVDEWICANPPGSKVAWDPYPTSLRIVNWLKWVLEHGELPEEHVTKSLVIQAQHLKRRLEYHILANHLWANGKALVFAGICLDGPLARDWLKAGMRIVKAELDEQLLDDGGHFERSPMYHLIVLEDLLDLYNLASSVNEQVPVATRKQWRCKAVSMFEWAAAMNHPDGELSFFNDSALGIAPNLQVLADYARRLGIAEVDQALQAGHRSRLMSSSGYARLSAGESVLLADVAEVGPDYQPGHAHADTLSFEYSWRGRRLFVNSGTSTYDPGKLRVSQRATAAHNSIEIDGLDSSEVWAGFRVARRARPGPVSIQGDERGGWRLTGSHDGYRRLAGCVVHQRKFQVTTRQLQICDTLDGTWKQAIAYFHLHPAVRPELISDFAGTLLAACGTLLEWRVEGAGVELVAGNWYPQFGHSQRNYSLRLTLTAAESRFRLELPASA